MKKIVNYCRYHIGGYFRKYKNILDRKKLTKKLENNFNFNPTIISQNCIGGVMSHDLGLQFTSPTINLFIKANDYIKFLENLDYYLNIDANEMIFTEWEQYPIGYLHDIKIYFVHYKDEIEAIESWNRRRTRVDKDNLFIVMTDRDGCTDEIVDRFLRLEYKNKVFFSHSIRENECVVYMPCFKNKQQVGGLTDFCSVFGKRYYEKYFDYIKWLTSNVNKNDEFGG